jgi:ABC-2 type transport system ATP-binding protein
MTNALLSIHNISKKYINQYVLKNITFDLYQKEIICLLGANGAGKTTLSNIISTLKKPTSGDILWKNISIYDQLDEYRNIVGYCPQQIPVYTKLTVYETLYHSAKLYGLEEEKTLNQVSKMIKLFFLEEHQYKIIENLSGGLKQRVGLARSLLHEPKLLILDEPTVALDSYMRKDFWDLLKKIKETGVTIVLTTHYLDEAEYLSDRIILLHQGIIHQITTSDKLLKEYECKNLEEAFIKFIKNLS